MKKNNNKPHPKCILFLEILSNDGIWNEVIKIDKTFETKHSENYL